MTDRELLEKAAKAAGFEWASAIAFPAIIGRSRGGSISKVTPWNPLEDDGDALRLAVKLRLAVSVLEVDVRAITSHGRHCAVEVLYGAESSEPLAATRRAIVRAAAAMPEAAP